MTLHWADLLVNAKELQALYGGSPPAGPLVVRSVHLNHYGPALTLRVDLPVFPSHPLPEWQEKGFDRFQCHLQFIAVEEVEMHGWGASDLTEVHIEKSGANRIRVVAESSSFTLSFDASDSVVIGHLSVFSVGTDGRDDGARAFLGKLDSRRFPSLPGLDEKTFYERI
ncbi:Imm50 family immunity protein [Streptomyces roseolus]|uniref:Imm50 family immunity protein n=1 Tax=Streptomyces roseolus TaxID=67358 RepID=UPI00365C5064